MDVFFEDSQSIEYSLSQKHLFYCFYCSSMKNDLPIAPHWHYYIELLYVIAGKGQLIIGGHPFTLTHGDMVYILPQDVHSIESIYGFDFEYAVIKFDPIILFDSSYDAFMFKNIFPIIQPIDPNAKIMRKAAVLDSVKHNIIETMSIFERKPLGYEFIVKSNLMILFYDLVISLNKKGYNIITQLSESNDITPILPALKYIHEHFSDSLTAQEIAKHCHLSYCYFSRLFKKVSGITFTKYLNFTRITEAERLLLKQSKSITEIGYLVGFNDTSYFIRQFKSFKHITPKQFLKLVLQDI